MERILNAPSSFKKASIERSKWKGNLRHFVNLTRSEHLSSIEEFAVVGSVVLLGTLGRPSTIGCAVWTVNVNSIYRVLRRRSLAHVAKEIGKIFPFFADVNPSIPVIWEVWAIRIAASIRHLVPYVILRRITHSVRNKPHFHFFGTKTPARFRIPISEMARCRYVKASAIAQTLPTLSSRTPQNKKTTESLVGYVNEFLRHLFDVSLIDHAVKAGG